jgi:hypothetical protein
MRFPTRVFILFLVMAILTSLIIAGFVYGPTRQIFMDLMRTNVLLVSEFTYVATRSRFRFEPAGEISLKGKIESARTSTIRKLA